MQLNVQDQGRERVQLANIRRRRLRRTLPERLAPRGGLKGKEGTRSLSRHRIDYAVDLHMQIRGIQLEEQPDVLILEARD